MRQILEVNFLSILKLVNASRRLTYSFFPGRRLYLREVYVRQKLRALKGNGKSQCLMCKHFEEKACLVFLSGYADSSVMLMQCFSKIQHKLKFYIRLLRGHPLHKENCLQTRDLYAADSNSNKHK